MNLFRTAVAMIILPLVTISPSISHAEEGTSLRVLSYNIKRGLGNDGKTDLARTASVINRLSPDFVGLQEVDEKTQRSGEVDQAAELGRQLGMHHSFAPFMDYDGGRYGLAILSRHPIRQSKIIELPKGNEPRVALAVDVELPDGQLITLVNLHFDWVRNDGFRFAQAKRLKQALTELTTPYILLGDFNDQPNSRTLELLGRGMTEADKPQDDSFTYSASKPSIEIDFIFVAPPTRWSIEHVDVVDEPIASDHRPVSAKIQLRPHTSSSADDR
ncbi:endonuclease/exonuclease/phosphatase family protein [Roseiconus lacunae]|uniref:endonuclease/exonuclease/phosphatase family protein n=1 Tax=Roseiconus lacunae TaxID=2605694 RepID=UPI00308F2A90|nr:endonuclease/exonuclease/phosphatase family protein [Roseiconus lacunae]WRQ50550.1 endonuclease/exonuclease/phosphatase family protein [Stieleria sp. HD01]